VESGHPGIEPRLFLRHADLAQAGEISGLEQSADLRYGGHQASEARKTIVATQPPSFGGRDSGAFGLAMGSIGGSEGVSG
jgi:hypothetical protein